MEPHKRYSLPPRSILKQKSNYDDDERTSDTLQISSQIQFPTHGLTKDQLLNGNNTTSRINTTQLEAKLNRRVSFAPDVTLHKFDFIPEVPVKFREPRRKSSLSVLEKSHDNDTMELTNPVTHAFDGLGRVEEPDAGYEAVFDKEVSMEITQLFTKHSARPESEAEGAEAGLGRAPVEETMELTNLHNLHGPLNTGTGDESMEMTDTHQAGPAPNEAEKNDANNGAEEEEDGGDDAPTPATEESMEITGQQSVGRIPSSGSPSAKLSGVATARMVSMDGDSMEITGLQQLSQAHEYREAPDATLTLSNVFEGPKHLNEQRAEETMDFTAFPKLNEALTIDSQVVTSTQEPPAYKALSTIKISPKRRKIAEGIYVSPVKPNPIEELFSDAERLSPIPLPPEYSPSRQANSSNPVLSPADVPKLPHDNYAMKAVDQQPKEEPVEPISLQMFLDTTGISFVIDLDGVQNYDPITFTYTDRIEDISTRQIYDALYLQIPLLEIYAFIVKELHRRILDSQRLFQELEEQISNNPPPYLFRNYFESSDEVKQLMKEQIVLIKSFARLEAKKVWFEWRCQHLKGIKSVLEENLSLVQTEYAEVVARLNEISDIKHRLQALEQSLRHELELLRNGEKPMRVTTLADRLKIEKIKSELKANMIKLNNTANLEEQKEAISADINALRSQIKDVREEISSLKSLVLKNKLHTAHDVSKLRLLFSQMQLFTGVSFRGLSGSELQLALNSTINVSFDLTQVDNIKDIAVSYQTESQFERHISTLFINEARHAAPNAFTFVLAVQSKLQHIRNVCMEYDRLQAIFPTRLVTVRDTDLIELTDLDAVRNAKVHYHIGIPDFVAAVTSADQKKITIRARVAYGKGVTQELLERHLLSRTKKPLPWFRQFQVVL
ncbi:AFL058Cp [Eremothecium gossypii ATCC 10895]|uniref:AFL058Cp n=1 Tax=Eremothecium gossypii (strain ATCC 10895 / CBS 109.51 / FGSC 9923 / NRRL Y-1056) TaxID=284811 RepID=Q754X4_EREGS|nr:AFL058Cp [Eremothecium gossypii ATCC 10895]AAS53314.1 AFL058Cp [Eremothecium gossypii ATCC 10895]AEY97625.1 FAFL058Cp [Eremothecium gossypii FDAG1]